MKEWLGTKFKSSCYRTDQFDNFARDFKNYLKKMLANDYEIIFKKGHFELFGFLKNKKTGKYAYFSISDVRYWQDEWFYNVLIRSAKNEKDFFGGTNQYCTLENIKIEADKLTN